MSSQVASLVQANGLTRYSVVVPVYRNEATLPQLIEALSGIAESLDNRLEAVFVVDGSPDRSFLVLRDLLGKSPFPSQLIALSRNFGSFAAIRSGLEAAHGPFFAVLAADLQEPPELIVSFFQALEHEPFDVAIGTRLSRDDPALQRMLANIFWGFFRRFIQPDVPPGGVDVFGCTQPVRDALLRLRESNSTLVGLLLWLGFRRKHIAYARRARSIGRSAWTFRRKLRYLLDSCFALTDLPMTLIMIVGAVGSLASVTLSIIVLIAWLVGTITVPGYTPLMLVVLNAFSLTMLALGIIGGYVWRSFENTKGRPLYVPMSHESFPANHR